MKTSRSWLIGLLGLSVLTTSIGQPQPFPRECRASKKAIEKLRKISGPNLHILNSGVSIVCSAKHPECCNNLWVTVTLNRKNLCVATLNYGHLTIDLRDNYKPELYWRLYTELKDEYVFDPEDGIQRLPIPGELMPIVSPHGFSNDRFKWTDTYMNGKANHLAVVHPKNYPLVTCQPEDPGIVNEQ